jgi:CheY-like chemotaxis protein
MTNILVVDDEELVRVTLCQMLEQAGYEVIEAYLYAREGGNRNNQGT